MHFQNDHVHGDVFLQLLWFHSTLKRLQNTLKKDDDLNQEEFIILFRIEIIE